MKILTYKLKKAINKYYDDVITDYKDITGKLDSDASEVINDLRIDELKKLESIEMLWTFYIKKRMI